MILNKKCMKCGKPATHKFVKIEKDQIYDMFYCEEHAGDASPYQKAKLSVSDLLAKFLSQEQASATGEEGAPESSLTCKTCGVSLDAYRKTLLLGCSDCYESFYEQLLPELRKFHGNVKHIGRKPGGGKESPVGEERHVPIESPTQGLPEPSPSATQGGSTLLKDPAAAIEELTNAMNEAIKNEDFEKAARCRDQIKELKAASKNK